MKMLMAVVLLMCGIAFGDQAKSAQKAYLAEEWTRAADLYGKLAEAEPKNSLYWYRWGTAARHAGDFEKAESALQKAIELGFQPMVARVGLVAVYSQSGNAEKALAIIEGLAKNGAPAASLIEDDAAFRALSSQPRFVAAMDSMKEQASPCKNHARHPEYRGFDFWIGRWDVYGMGGALAGRSHVELILGNCVVSENWTSAIGNSGKSYNKYNAPLKRWEQYWVDQSGTTTFYTGNLQGSNMVFLADGSDQTGKPQKLRMTFFPLTPDKVRQFGEVSNDDGKTWITSFDLTYIRQTENTKDNVK